MGQSKFLLVLFLLSISLQAAAKPYVNFRILKDASGTETLSIFGGEVCDAKLFKVRIAKDILGDGDWYVSSSGKSEWQINSCMLDPVYISKDAIKPGYIMQVRTFDSTGNKNHVFNSGIPCDTAKWPVVFDGSYTYENVSASFEACTNNPPPPPPLTCNLIDQVSPNNNTIVNVSIYCNYVVNIHVIAWENTSTQGPNNFQKCSSAIIASPEPKRVCSFYRKPEEKFLFQVRAATSKGDLIFDKQRIIYKDPTFSFPVEGKVTSEKSLVPPARDRILNNGKYWSFKARVKVQDSDVDPTERRDLIRVEAYVKNKDGEKRLDTEYANSGEELTFSFLHEHIVPKVWGSPRHTDEGFIMGTNTVYFLVYEAYSKVNPIRLPEEITVELKE